MMKPYIWQTSKWSTLFGDAFCQQKMYLTLVLIPSQSVFITIVSSLSNSKRKKKKEFLEFIQFHFSLSNYPEIVENVSLHILSLFDKALASKVAVSVTRWLEYFFNVWPFLDVKSRFKFLPNSKNTLKNDQRILKSDQSDEISPNLATLVRCDCVALL